VVRLRYTEEELGDNLSLMSKLKLEFGVDLPGMPPQEDLGAYLDAVEQSVSSLPHWTVVRDAVTLGFFSFSASCSCTGASTGRIGREAAGRRIAP
jgi:hypothetical protein